MTAVIIKIDQDRWNKPRYCGAVIFGAYYASSDTTIKPKKLLLGYYSDTIEGAYEIAVSNIQQKKDIYLKSDRWTVSDTETGFTAVNKESGSMNTYEMPSVVDMWG